MVTAKINFTCVTSSQAKEIVMLYIVYDSEHCPLRRFHSKVDAEWFVKDKPECEIKKIKQPQQPKKSWTEEMAEFTAKYGEPPF